MLESHESKHFGSWKAKDIDHLDVKANTVIEDMKTRAQSVMAQLILIGKLKHATLTSFGEYDSWNIKVVTRATDRNLLETKLRELGPLGEKWIGFPLEVDLFSFTATRVRAKGEQLALLEELNDPNAQKLQEVAEGGHYPFGYDGTSKLEPDPGCELDRFQQGAWVAVEIPSHSTDMQLQRRPYGFLGSFV